MARNHDELKELVIASVCGTAPRQRIAEVEGHLAECDECRHLKDEFMSMAGALRSANYSAPEKIDLEIRALIEAGVQEDPWVVAWERAHEIGAGGLTSPKHASPPDSTVREAAEIEDVPADCSFEAAVRNRCHRVAHIRGCANETVVLAAFGVDKWVGVLVSPESVPIRGAHVLWRGAAGQNHQVRTDERGSFVIGDEQDPPMSVTIGHPAIVEFSFTAADRPVSC